AFRRILKGDTPTQVPGRQAVYKLYARMGVTVCLEVCREAGTVVLYHQPTALAFCSKRQLDVAAAVPGGIADQLICDCYHGRHLPDGEKHVVSRKSHRPLPCHGANERKELFQGVSCVQGLDIVVLLCLACEDVVE